MVALFDDGQGRLGTMTDLRAAYEVRTGALTTLERWENLLGEPVDGLACPERVRAVCEERLGRKVNDVGALAQRAGAEGVVFVSGRCVLPFAEAADLKLRCAVVEKGSGHVIAARLAGGEAEAFARDWKLPAGVTVEEWDVGLLVHRPWDVIRLRDEAILHDLARLSDRDSQELPPEVLAIGEEGLTIDPTAAVYPTVVFDLEHGPVVVAEEAVIRPGAIVCGPAFIGAHSTVMDRAHVKANTAIGPWCKVGGEVGGTIFQGWANKSHEGHLGDSWVGEWANLGAGTTNSNLLNTYGEVMSKAGAGAPTERTGLTFFGSVIGDHVKTAICTRLMTGVTIGTGTMVASSAYVSGAVPAMRWVTDGGEKAYRFEKFMEVARAMMARRKMAPGKAYTEALRALGGERA